MSNPKYNHIGSPKDRLVEELGELLQAISKGERFGWDNHHPKRKMTNLEELEFEWIDVKKAYVNFRTNLNDNQKDLPDKKVEKSTPATFAKNIVSKIPLTIKRRVI